MTYLHFDGRVNQSKMILTTQPEGVGHSIQLLGGWYGLVGPALAFCPWKVWNV
jgi:hypothetical protein